MGQNVFKQSWLKRVQAVDGPLSCASLKVTVPRTGAGRRL